MSLFDETRYYEDNSFFADVFATDENGHLSAPVVIGLIILASMLVGLALVFMDAVL